ncbi:MAG: ATP-dependent DNA helicase RecG [Candidatus Woykebacteria bacterium]
MDLDTPVVKIPKIGPFYAKKLNKLKIDTLHDLIYHFPFRYGNLGQSKKINQLGPGDFASIKGSVWQIRNIRTRFGKNLTLATVNDGTSSIEVVWFNQPFLTSIIKQTQAIGISGKVSLFANKLTFVSPEYELLRKPAEKGTHTQGFVSVYPETAGVSSKWLRTRIKEVLPTASGEIEEFLPPDSLVRNKLISRQKAIWQIHFPKTQEQIEQARKRLAFDELLLTQLNALGRKKFWAKNQQGVKLDIFQEKILSALSNLPFELTTSQKKVLKEIFSDMTSGRPMNRLLQGDVGSGKTVVAALAAYNVFLNGYQTALMAPTEILAHQHYTTLKTILAPLKVKIVLRTSQIKKSEPHDILIGTHALLTKSVDFDSLALVIIDEQHRFGVKQRGLLRQKGKTPHVLTMTATPIPRSLALTLYGDLDLSTISEMPKGRKKVKTYVVPPSKRAGAYQFIRDNAASGNQTFILCPLIEPSETLNTVKAATQEYLNLNQEIFPDLKLGLLHGKLKYKEKERVVERFRARELQVLVSTPVVEVGIDIPDAVIMMIEAAERFGLASLHQLRGRVGRSQKQSFCLLFTESNTPAVSRRLKAMEKYHLGSDLAEIDLKTRGPGEIYGTVQSGLPNFRVASLSDLVLIKLAKEEAKILFGKSKISQSRTFKAEMQKLGLVPPD